MACRQVLNGERPSFSYTIFLNRFSEILCFLIVQKQLADALSLSNVQLSRYELGSRTPDPDTIVKIATFFNVSTDFLLGMTPSVKEPKLTYESNEAQALIARIKELEGLEPFIKSCLESPHLFQTLKDIWLVLKKHA